MDYTLGQAARRVGKAKSTLSRDVKTGRLSATRNDNGSLTIEAAELHRVYSMSNGANGSSNLFSNKTQPREHRDEHLLERLIAEQAARIASLEADKEDLRRRLDQATALLTDQRTSSAVEPVGPWWRRLVGR